jgi:hypothetical protein
MGPEGPRGDKGDPATYTPTVTVNFTPGRR